MKFAKVFYRYNTTALGPATVLLGADSDPTTLIFVNGAPPIENAKPAANADNILFCRVNSVSSATPVERIAVAMCGPSGAAACTANLYVWDAGTSHWYLCNASPVTLTLNTLAFFDVAALCEDLVGQATQGGMAYMLVVIPPGSPTAGQYSFAMSAVLNTP